MHPSEWREWRKLGRKHTHTNVFDQAHDAPARPRVDRLDRARQRDRAGSRAFTGFQTAERLSSSGRVDRIIGVVRVIFVRIQETVHHVIGVPRVLRFDVGVNAQRRACGTSRATQARRRAHA